MPKKRLTKLTQITHYLTLDQMFEQFLHFKRAQGLSDRTLSDYNRHLNAFQDFTNINSSDMNTLKDGLLKFFASKRDKAPATFNLPYQYLNTFFIWAVQQDYLENNPLKQLGLRKKKDEGRARNIEAENIKKLLDILDLTTYTGLRDYALILLLLDTGMRPCEATGLKNSDVDFRYYNVTIRREIAKTRTSRTLPLTPQTTEVIYKYVQIKPTEWEDYLFTTADGNKMSTDRWGKRLQIYSQKINCKITPYDLRHSFAIMFLRNGGNVFALQREMGHVDISMTKRYCNLAQEDLVREHKLASPVQNFLKRNTRVQKLFKGK